MSKEIIKTKICKICGKEKPVNEFAKNGKKNEVQLYNSNCKLCKFFSKRTLHIKNNWTKKEYFIIVDNLINKKVKCVNDILCYLNNKTLDDLVDLLFNDLKLNGIKVRVRLNCNKCGKEFYKTMYEFLKEGNHFCSKNCYDLSQITSIEKKCDCCGKTIQVPPQKIKTNKHFFCSQKCDKKYKSENKIIKLHCWTEIECLFCKMKFKVLKSELKRRDRKFCSQECFKNWNKANYIVYNCDYCNKVNEVRPSSFNKDAKLHFCNSICRTEYAKKISNENLITFNCDACGKVCKQTPYEYNLSKNHFCSRKCVHSFQRNNYNCKDDYVKCNICNKEKPISEFIKSEYKCKVCSFIDRNNFNIVEGWDIKEYKIILDNLLNKKVEVINDLIPLLNNKKLEDILNLLKNELKIGGSIPLRVNINCANCNKMIIIKPSAYFNRKNCFCSSVCQGIYYGKIRSKNKKMYKHYCKYCGKEFSVNSSREKNGKNKFCSPDCSQKSRIDKIKVKCSYCGKDKLVTPSVYKENKNHFCNAECTISFRSEQAREIRKCEICNKKYETFKNSTQRFCSLDCQIEWQKLYPRTGKNHPNFNSEMIICDWCGKKYYEPQCVINSDRNNFFCSIKCRQEWFANIYSQTEEFRNASRKRAVEMLSDGAFNHTETKPQIILNNILDKLNIKYVNEYNCKYVSMDNYLLEYNLMIECMGTFWHCDNRFYDKINYAIQKQSIKQDKIKNTYIKSQYNISILYLWEYDIMNNPTLCKQLILKYINNRGILENYHSFNYAITNDGLILKDNLIKPYMEWESKKLNEIVNSKVKKEMSKKQHDKWITFNCEYCGKEKEQLKSRYRKAKNHFCSWECHHAFRRKENKVLELV